jgi:serine/threonine protein phosphatase PrpC
LIDGLWDRQLDEIVRAADSAPVAKRLIDAALERAGRDNITAMVVEALATPLSSPTPQTTAAPAAAT